MKKHFYRAARWALIALAVLCVIGVETARAEHGIQQGGIQPFVYRSSATLYSLGMVPVPPYFALHPPVYYGERYTRPYGLSPYACQCQLQATEGYMGAVRTRFPSSHEILNQHMPQGEVKSAPVAEQSAQMIINPYVEDADHQSAQFVLFPEK